MNAHDTTTTEAAPRADTPPRFLVHDGTFFFYSGFFSQSLVAASADAIRMRLDGLDQSSKTRRRILSAFIEMGQNIVHYSAETLTDVAAQNDEIRFGMIRISYKDGHFTLHCSNPVCAPDATRLESKLRVISNMSLDEIRDSYREALRAEEGEATSKGGGLGFLTLAREASEPLVFSFDPVEDHPELRMFNLVMTV